MAESQEIIATRRDLRGSNQSGVRAHNERLVLSLLRIHGPTAKAEIARLTGLSAQTVSVIMRALENEGLIERGKPVRGKVGQPSTPMLLAPDGAHFFGAKIGRRSADVVLVDFVGNIIGRVHQPYRYPTPDQTIRFIQDAVDNLTSNHRPPSARIAGLGIALPGYLWEWASEFGAPEDEMAAWKVRDIRAELSKSFDFPVFLRNDASCACAAELVFGRRATTPHFLYFYVGHLIGGGIVLNNSLFTGPTGNAGAIGPIPLPAQNGGQQLVSVASLASLESMIEAAGGNSKSLWEDPGSWDVEHEILQDWLEQVAGGLAYAIAAACSIIDFELIIIDGWLPDDIRAKLVRRTSERMSEIDMSGIHAPELREGSIGADARSLGAASIPLSKRFLVDRDAFIGAL